MLSERRRTREAKRKLQRGNNPSAPLLRYLASDCWQLLCQGPIAGNSGLALGISTEGSPGVHDWGKKYLENSTERAI